jgi:hypothetical protein
MGYCSTSPDGLVRVDFTLEEMRFEEWERPAITLTDTGRIVLDAPRDWHGKVRWHGTGDRFDLEIFRIGKRGHLTAEVHPLEGVWRFRDAAAWRRLEEMQSGIAEELDRQDQRLERKPSPPDEAAV